LVIEDWKRYILGAGTQRAILETEANNFAGCLLMPKPEILNEYSQHEKIATQQFAEAKIKAPDQKTFISYIANKIAKKFEVSEQAAEIRLSKVLKSY
jgi:Zn-dependent peptidase ImmA (M78 family)